MKVMYCQVCGDIISPHREAKKPRWCSCNRHAVWWENPYTGACSLHDRYGINGRPEKGDEAAWLLGITNLFLQAPDKLRIMSKDNIDEIIDAHEDTYLFKRQRSPIVRFRPGGADMTQYAPLPGTEKKEEPPKDRPTDLFNGA